MTEPMTDERFKDLIWDRVLDCGCQWRIDELADEIRRLREEVETYESVDACANCIKTENENAKLREVIDLALDCWGPVEKRPRTDFVLRSKAFMKALRKLDEEDR